MRKAETGREYSGIVTLKQTTVAEFYYDAVVIMELSFSSSKRDRE